MQQQQQNLAVQGVVLDARAAAAPAPTVVAAHANKKPEAPKTLEKLKVTLQVIKEKLAGLPVDPFGIMGSAKALAVTLIMPGRFTAELLDRNEHEELINAPLNADAKLHPKLTILCRRVHSKGWILESGGKKTFLGTARAEFLVDKFLANLLALLTTP